MFLKDKYNFGKLFRFLTLGLNAVSLFFLLLCFFVPLCSYEDASGEWISVNVLNVFENANVTLFAILGALLAVNVLAVVLFVRTLQPFRTGSDVFFRRSQKSVFFNLFAALGFSVAGFVIFFIDASAGRSVRNTSMFPLIASLIVTVLHAVCNMFNESEQAKPAEKQQKRSLAPAKITGVAFLLILAVLAIVTCLMNLVTMEFEGLAFSDTVELNGWKLLTDSEIPETFQPVAFLVFAAVVVVAVATAISFAAVASGSAEERTFATVAVGVDILVILGIGIFSKYYEIAININLDRILDYYSVFGLSVLPTDYSLRVTGVAFWMIPAATLVAVALLILKPYTKLEKLIAPINVLAEGQDRRTEEPAEDDLEIENDLTDGDPAEKEPQLPDEPLPAPEEQNFDNCPSFSEIDRSRAVLKSSYAKAKEAAFAEPTLQSLVRFVVKYAAESKNHLSYKEEDIATFVAGLGMSRLSILQGLSGTGKTSLPKIFTEALLGRCEIVEVESSWKDKHDLLGYYNEFTKVYSPKKFTQALYRAVLTPDVPVFIVLDEMNLSRIEYYFSDFLSLMENDEDKRFIRVVDRRIFNTVDGTPNRYAALVHDNTIQVPANVWFVGTANRDESTFEISDKVYDRANTMNFMRRAPKASYRGEVIPPAFMSVKALSSLLQGAVDGFEFDIESNAAVSEVEKLLQPYNIAFGNRVMKQMETFVKVYCSCFDNKYARVDEAVEKILLSKVVRKLEGKNIRNKQELVHGFEKLRLYECSAFVNALGGDSFYD